MSYLNQVSRFYSNSRLITFVADPQTIEAIETIALTLGANRDEEDYHRFHFNCLSDLNAERALKALELVWENLKYPRLPPFQITICYGNRFILVEGDTQQYKAFLSLVKSFNKEIKNGIITFNEDEEAWFEALHEAAVNMGVIPYC